MKRRSGFTLVELMLVTTLMTMVIGIAAMLFSFILKQCGHASTTSAQQLRAIRAVEKLRPIFEQAIACDIPTYSNGTKSFLRVYYPSSLVQIFNSDANDNQQSGYISNSSSAFASPQIVDNQGYERFSAGQCIWLYLSDSTGNTSASGDILWRALTSQTSLPSTGDALWSMYKGTTVGKIPFVTSFTYSVNNSLHTVTVTLVFTNNPDATVLGGGYDSGVDTITVTRTFYCRNWRSYNGG